MILIAASVWLALRSGPAPQTVATRAGGHDVSLPPSRPLTPETTTAAETGRAGMRSGAAGARRRAQSASPRTAAVAVERMVRGSGEPGSPASAAAGLPVAALPALTISALEPPDALAVAPLTLDGLTVERMEIPLLEVGPVNPGAGSGTRH